MAPRATEREEYTKSTFAARVLRLLRFGGKQCGELFRLFHPRLGAKYVFMAIFVQLDTRLQLSP